MLHVSAFAEKPAVFMLEVLLCGQRQIELLTTPLIAFEAGISCLPCLHCFPVVRAFVWLLEGFVLYEGRQKSSLRRSNTFWEALPVKWRVKRSVCHSKAFPVIRAAGHVLWVWWGQFLTHTQQPLPLSCFVASSPFHTLVLSFPASLPLVCASFELTCAKESLPKARAGFGSGTARLPPTQGWGLRQCRAGSVFRKTE